MKKTWRVCALVLLGCGASNQPSEELFTVTAVQLDGTAARVVATELLTRDQVVRQLAPAARGVDDGVLEQGITQTACSGSVAALYDKTPGQCIASGCNLICFAGQGHAGLTNYCRTRDPFGFCTSTWYNHVGSANGNGLYAVITMDIHDPICQDHPLTWILGPTWDTNPSNPCASTLDIY